MQKLLKPFILGFRTYKSIVCFLLIWAVFLPKIGFSQTDPCVDWPTIGNSTELTIITEEPSFSEFRIIGDVRFLSIVNLSNKTIKVEPDKEIFVAGTLIIENTTIEGCRQMWKGITLEKSATTFVLSNSRVSDAQNAIKSEASGCSITMYYSALTRNNVGIRAKKSTIGTFPSLYFSGFVIDDSETFLPTNLPLETENFGLHLTNIKFFNAYPEEDEFTIINCGVGIFAKNCAGRIRDVEFIKTTNYGKNVQGIRLHGSIADINNNTFDFCNFGIGIAKSAYWVHENVFKNNRIGVSAQKTFIAGNSILTTTPQMGIPTIENNQFLAKNFINLNYAINLYDNPFAAYMVRDNLIEGVINRGVNLIEPASTSLFGNVQDNNLKCLAGTFPVGVKVNSANSINICHNTITGAISQSNFRAIQASNLFGSTVSNNISFSTALNDNDLGISLQGSVANMVTCNHLNDSKIGMEVIGTCTETDISTNEFLNHNVGLRYNNAFTGIQTHRGNRWLSATSATMPGATFVGAAFLSSSSNYDVNPSENAQFLPFATPTDWFSPTVNPMPPTITCSAPPSDCFEADHVEMSNVGLLNQIKNGEVTFPEYSAAINWSLRNEILKTAYKKGETAGLGSFWTNKISQSEGLDTRLMMMADNWRSQNQVLLVALAEKMDSIKTMLQQPGAPNNELIGATSLEIQLLNGQIESSFQGLLNNMLTECNVTSSGVSNHEFNNRTVHRIWIEHLLAENGQISAGDLALLTTISTECPLEGGNAVYAARGLKEIVTGVSEDFEHPCELSLQERSNEILSEKAPQNQVKISPNPNSGEMTINASALINLPSEVIVMDFSGRIVLRKTISQNVGEIEIKLNNSGLYWIQLLNSEGQILSTNKIIVHQP
jgi:hypothetical protein